MSLAAFLLAFGPVTQGFEEASARLARAAELVCKGRHADALAVYRELAKDSPGTPEGQLALARTAASAFLGACPLVENGPSRNRVDVVLLGDGYKQDHLRAFDELAEDIPPLFERVEPFREYWRYLNFLRGVCVSAEAGVDGFGRQYDTLLGGFTRATDAGHVGIERQAVLDVVAQIPGADGLAIVFVKLGVAGSGSRDVAVIGGRNARTVVHEWGHSFAHLGDEYSSHTHQRGAPSDGINVAASDDPERAPWRHWLEARHPSVGLYEGAQGQAQDAWRPTASGCVMNDGEHFCPVCREALVLRLYAFIDPIDAVSPPAPPPSVREPILLWDEPIEIVVQCLQPATHDLEVSWWLESAAKYPLSPSAPGAPAARPREFADRTQRGPLPAMGERPTRRGGAGKDGRSVLRLSRLDLERGLYRVTCRVRDTTEVFGEKWPWVLKDERGLLESERVWWVEVR
jgi:hypothetical protein